MSRNLETVKEIYAAFGRGDVAFILSVLDDEVAWESWADNQAARVGVPWLVPRRGKAGAAEFFGLVGSVLMVKDFRVLALMDGGDKVSAEFEIECDVPSSGGHYRDEEMHLWSFNDAGKVVRLRHYTDTAKHIRAAGLS
ncbi:MAG: nuclear transport factor 2 family protein [Vicinamibacterales bacterium]